MSRIDEIRARLRSAANGKTEIKTFDYHEDVRFLLDEIDHRNAAAKAENDAYNREADRLLKEIGYCGHGARRDLCQFLAPEYNPEGDTLCDPSPPIGEMQRLMAEAVAIRRRMLDGLD